MGHPDKAILPAAQTRPVFSTDFPHSFVFTFFFFWETRAAFCDPQPRSRLRQKRSVFNMGSLAASWELCESVVPPLLTKFIASLTVEI